MYARQRKPMDSVYPGLLAEHVLGVRRGRLPQARDLDVPAGYVPQAVDRDIARALDGATPDALMVLLLVGESGTGRSAALAAAVRARCRRFAVIRPRHRHSLPTLLGKGPEFDDVVLLLDPFPAYVGREGLETKDMQKLRGSGARVIVAGTATPVQAEALARFGGDWSFGVSADIVRMPLPPAEPYPPPLAAWRNDVRSTVASVLDGPDRLGAAVLRAATDWSDLGQPDPAPFAVIARMAAIHAISPIDPEQVEQAAGRLPTSIVRIDRGITAIDYAAACVRAMSPPLSAEAYRVVMSTPVDEWRPGLMAIAATLHPDPDLLLPVLELLAENHGPAAMRLAGLAWDRHQPAEALKWYVRAAGHGVTDAPRMVAEVLRDQGDSAAEDWARLAGCNDEDLRRGGALFLGGDPAQARSWLVRAAERRSLLADRYLLDALLLDDDDRHQPVNLHGLVEKAVTSSGEEPGLANSLGVYFERQGMRELRKAADWYHTAMEEGDAVAANNLAVLYTRLDRLTEAHELLEQLARDGSDGAAYNLGLVSQRLGRAEQARASFLRAWAAGVADAAFELARLAEDRRDLAVAETWYRRALDAGHAPALAGLGRVLDALGRRTEAAPLMEQARALGL